MPPLRSSASPPSAPHHIKGVERHLEWAQGLRASNTDDWFVVGQAITALFYSAVHAVRAYLVACKGVRVSDHKHMEDLFDTYPELKKSKVIYSLLKNESESARYYLNEDFEWQHFDQLLSRAELLTRHWKEKALACVR